MRNLVTFSAIGYCKVDNFSQGQHDELAVWVIEHPLGLW